MAALTPPLDRAATSIGLLACACLSAAESYLLALSQVSISASLFVARMHSWFVVLCDDNNHNHSYATDDDDCEMKTAVKLDLLFRNSEPKELEQAAGERELYSGRRARARSEQRSREERSRLRYQQVRECEYLATQRTCAGTISTLTVVRER